MSKNALAQRLYSGVHPGLPAPMQRVPFGHQCPWREALGLTRAEAHMVCALVAAEFVGLGPVSVRQLVDACGYRGHNLAGLERAGWIEVAGFIPKRSGKLWKATEKAWRELGLQGWSLLKEVA